MIAVLMSTIRRTSRRKTRLIMLSRSRISLPSENNLVRLKRWTQRQLLWRSSSWIVNKSRTHRTINFAVARFRPKWRTRQPRSSLVVNARQSLTLSFRVRILRRSRPDRSTTILMLQDAKLPTAVITLMLSRVVGALSTRLAPRLGRAAVPALASSRHRRQVIWFLSSPAPSRCRKTIQWRL